MKQKYWDTHSFYFHIWTAEKIENTQEDKESACRDNGWHGRVWAIFLRRWFYIYPKIEFWMITDFHFLYFFGSIWVADWKK